MRKNKYSEKTVNDTILRISLIVAVHIIGGISLLAIELPETPIRWWGWIIPFLLPIPIYFVLSKFEAPQEPKCIQEYSPSRRVLSWNFKLAKALTLFYFACLYIVWLGIKPLLY